MKLRNPPAYTLSGPEATRTNTSHRCIRTNPEGTPYCLLRPVLWFLGSCFFSLNQLTHASRQNLERNHVTLWEVWGFFSCQVINSFNDTVIRASAGSRGGEDCFADWGSHAKLLATFAGKTGICSDRRAALHGMAWQSVTSMDVTA